MADMNHQHVAKYFSIDVECVATGKEHNAREVAQIALVDQFERCLLNVYVKPPDGATVHSYLTPLTGITAELIEANGVSLAEAVGQLRTALPKHAVLETVPPLAEAGCGAAICITSGFSESDGGEDLQVALLLLPHGEYIEVRRWALQSSQPHTAHVSDLAIKCH